MVHPKLLTEDILEFTEEFWKVSVLGNTLSFCLYQYWYALMQLL